MFQMEKPCWPKVNGKGLGQKNHSCLTGEPQEKLEVYPWCVLKLAECEQ